MGIRGMVKDLLPPICSASVDTLRNKFKFRPIIYTILWSLYSCHDRGMSLLTDATGSTNNSYSYIHLCYIFDF